MLVEETARLYHCSRCRIQICICRSCDRGNVYCQACAPIARKESVKAARLRYEHTYAGKLNNAARQKRYVKKKKAKQYTTTDVKKITDQGSNEIQFHDSLPFVIPEPEILNNGVITCYFCGRNCSAFLRVDFLQSSAGARKRFNEPLRQGP